MTKPASGGGTERIALVVGRRLSAGQAANVSALLMGQLAQLRPDIYAEPVIGSDASSHVGIRHSTVVLTAGPGQLRSLAEQAVEADLSSCVFSSIGQSLNNRFDEYAAQLAVAPEIELVGVGLGGDDTQVRELTSKFSVLK